MKKLTLLFLAAAAAMSAPLSASAQYDDGPCIKVPEGYDVGFNVYDYAVFYDGYLYPNVPDYVPQYDGIIRHYAHLMSTKLSEDMMDSFGQKIKMEVLIDALCDNYDRIGNVNLAFVPKGKESYKIDDADVERIEIARFITPFMDMTKSPNQVPYLYDIDYLTYLFHDTQRRAKYDYWLEFELFGVPYAANEQITGCGGRNDVFAGTLNFYTTEPQVESTDTHMLIPLNMKEPEFRKNFNNYTEGCTDEIGTTQRTWEFTIPQEVTDARIVFIISNHGANSGGEEYNRRYHYIYLDDEMQMSFKPGRESCEPFRKYNTQPNGIYGYTAQSDEKWQSFSNWCPGDVIDTRFLELGAIAPGTHAFQISVPKAKFASQQGDFPVSVYLQATTKEKFSKVETVLTPYEESVAYGNGILSIEGDMAVKGIDVFSLDGRVVATAAGQKEINLSQLHPAFYIANVEFADGTSVSKKIQVK